MRVPIPLAIAGRSTGSCFLSIVWKRERLKLEIRSVGPPEPQSMSLPTRFLVALCISISQWCIRPGVVPMEGTQPTWKQRAPFASVSTLMQTHCINFSKRVTVLGYNSHRSQSGGQSTFRTNCHVSEFSATFQPQVAKSASFHEKPWKVINLAKTSTFSDKLSWFRVFSNFLMLLLLKMSAT